MLSLAWPICGAGFLLAGTGVAWWRQRPDPAAPFAARPGRPSREERDAADRAPADPARRWSLDELIDLLPHPVLALAGDGTLLHANQAAYGQFGDALSSLLRHPRLGEAIRTLAPGATAELEIALDVPVRRVLRAALGADRRQDATGLILLSLTDRSEQDAVARMRSDFIANASHELRTPLASLIGFIETLQGPAADDPPARIRFLAIMAGQAARMRRLIDNLLSLSRIQINEHERPSGLVAIGPLLQRVADEHEPQVAASGIALRIEIAADLPLVAADPDQLAQVLHNLLDNAVKYASRPGRNGQVVLSARNARPGLDPSPDGIVLSVEDDGPGIAAKDVPRLTERFYRVEDSAAGKTGSGLGLAIVKHIVGRHRGRLTIESRVGEGTRVGIWLPCVPRALDRDA